MSRWRLERWRASRGPRPARETLAVTLDDAGIAWTQGGVAVRAAHIAHGGAAGSLDPLTDAAARCARVEVTAALDVAVHWVQVPPRELRSLEELRQVVSVRCAHLHGGAPQDWWVAGDWNGGRPFVCAGLPFELVTPLREALVPARAKVQWETAWSLLCRRHARQFPDHGWSAWRSGSRLVLWHCRAGRIDCLRTIALAPDAADEVARRLVVQQQGLERLRDPSLTADGPRWVVEVA